jgi:Cgr1 family
LKVYLKKARRILLATEKTFQSDLVSSSSMDLSRPKKAMFVDSFSRQPLAHEVEDKQLMQGDIVQMSLTPSTKGRNASGRNWKVRPQKRASSLVKTKVNNRTKSWEERKQEQISQKEATELQSELREERRQAKLRKKERRLENERRRAENEFKEAQKSVKELNIGRLKSTMKAMSKKQLRQIKKTRMNSKTGVVEYVSAYAK